MMHVRSARPRLAAVVFASGLLAAGGLASAQDAAKPASDLPPGKEVFDKAVEAMGGRKKLDDIKSITYKVSMAESMGPGAPESIIVNGLLPDQVHLKGTFAEGETAVMVFNGKHAWSTEPGDEEPTLDDPEQIQTMMPLFCPQVMLLGAPKVYKTMETTEKTEFNGKGCYKVKMSDEKGERTASVFINADNAAVEGIEIVFDAEMGLFGRVTVLERKEVDGVHLISKMKMHMPFGDETMELSFSDFTFNKVEKKLFDVPESLKEEIKAMDDLKKGGGEGTEGGIK